MYTLKAAYERLGQHARLGPDGLWRCNATGAVIQAVGTGQSIWIAFPARLPGGFGDVAMVLRPYCPACDLKPELPSYGTPIYEDELLETR